MRCQCSFLQELATTHGARVRYPTMELSMIDELEFTSECSPAVIASKRIDRTVETRVHIQVLFLSETFSAIL
jgi:hypothetical protein